MMCKRTTVGIRQDVYSRLRNKGKFGESFSELISRLIDDTETNITNNGGNDLN